MEELDTHVDDATDKLKAETRHAELIKERTSDCKAYICILVEVIVLCIMVVVLFLKPK
jgi:t-SNARE complex subunit (syntaxin)